MPLIPRNSVLAFYKPDHVWPLPPELQRPSVPSIALAAWGLNWTQSMLAEISHISNTTVN